MAAGGAVLNPQLRYFFPHPAEEPKHGLHILPQAFTQAVRVVASHADTVVIVNLRIAKAAFLQQADYTFIQIGLNLRLAEIHKPAVICIDHRTPAGQQHFFFPEYFRSLCTGFRLKPDPGNHTMRPDHIRRCLQALGKHGFLFRNPISAALMPYHAFPAIPARVNHQEIKPVSLYPVCDLFQVFMARISPGRAVFVEQYRQFRVRPGHIGPVNCQQPLAYPVDSAASDCHIGFRCLKALTRRNGLCPLSEILIRQRSHHVQPVILPADFHLPGGGTGDLHCPGHIMDGIFNRREGEPAPYRHGTNLAELHNPQGMTRPGPLQHRFLNGIRNQPALCAPGASGPVKQQGAAGVPVREGSNPAEVQAREQIQRHRFPCPVFKPNRNPQGFQSFFPFQCMENRAAGLVRKLGHHRIAFLYLVHKTHTVRGRCGCHRMAVPVSVRQLVSARVNLHKVLQGILMFPHLILHSGGDQGHPHMVLFIQPPGHQDIPEFVFTETFHFSSLLSL